MCAFIAGSRPASLHCVGSDGSRGLLRLHTPSSHEKRGSEAMSAGASAAAMVLGLRPAVVRPSQDIACKSAEPRRVTALCRHRDATASRSQALHARGRSRASRHGPSRGRRTRRCRPRSTMKFPGCVSANATVSGCARCAMAGAMPRRRRSSSAISARASCSGTASSRKRMAFCSTAASVSRKGFCWRGIDEPAAGSGKAWMRASVSAIRPSSSGRRGARPSTRSTISAPPGRPGRGSITSCRRGVRPDGARWRKASACVARRAAAEGSPSCA